MPVLHFSTFLKLLALPTSEKLKAVAKYGESSGGFDYWKSLRSGCIQYCAHSEPREDVYRHILSNSGPQNGPRCVEAFDITANWIDRQTGQGFAPNRGVWASPARNFSVHIEPEVGLSSSKTSKVTAIYPTASAVLTADVAGAGLILLRNNYRSSTNEEFGIYQVGNNRCYRRITNNAEAMLAADIATLDRAFGEL